MSRRRQVEPAAARDSGQQPARAGTGAAGHPEADREQDIARNTSPTPKPKPNGQGQPAAQGRAKNSPPAPVGCTPQAPCLSSRALKTTPGPCVAPSLPETGSCTDHAPRTRG